MPSKSARIQGNKIIALDARPDRIDLRDLPYRAPMINLPPRFPTDEEISEYLPAYMNADLILNQGQEGACTGFGLAATINYLLWRQSQMQSVEKVSPRMLYTLARYYDEWPDENYEGSSCRGALKGWQRHGVCLEHYWPYEQLTPTDDQWADDAIHCPLGVYYRIEKQSVVDMQAAISQTGAIYVSANVHGGWTAEALKIDKRNKSAHGRLPIINYSEESPDILGGHAFALVGYNENGFIVQNSWGPGWGEKGFAVLTYRDWIANGSDAWVVGLGVPLANGRAPMVHVGTQACPTHQVRPMGTVATAAMQSPRKSFTREDAYQHTLVTGNNGVLLNRMPHLQDADSNADYVVVKKPAAWLQDRPEGERRVALYFHGGLGSEESSIARIQVLAPWFLQNGIYPLFLTWKSGWIEVIKDMVADKAVSLFGTQPVRGLGEWFDDARDRAIEVLARDVLVRSMWSEMKQNVEASADGLGTGIAVLAEKLHMLREAVGDDLQIHMIGHSAGALVAGRLLTEFHTSDYQLRANSCTLFAPACTVAFALKHYMPSIKAGALKLEDLVIHTLSAPLELADSVGPYRKSLLYLISRSLESLHKTPVLGLASVFDGSRTSEEFWHKKTIEEVIAWQRFFWGETGAPEGITGGDPQQLEGARLRVLHQPDVHTGNNGGQSVKSAHGAFDNAYDIMSATLQRILGGSDLPSKDVDLSSF